MSAFLTTASKSSHSKSRANHSSQLTRGSSRLVLLKGRSPCLPSPSCGLKNPKHRRIKIKELCVSDAEERSHEGTQTDDSAIQDFITGLKFTVPPSLEFGGLPSDICQLYLTKRNIKGLYGWQSSCISDKRILEGCNMIILLPTGAGKTLVAEVLMLRETLVSKKCVLFILPYVAIVQEKMQSLSVFNETFDIWIEEYAASKGRIPPIKRRKNQSVYVATIEKANMLINSLIETGRISEIGLVIVDELHMLGEGSRGAVLEQALVKYLLKGRGQIVGITATLANVGDVARFLNAEVFTTNFRPVKLTQRVKITNTLYTISSGGKLIPELQFGKNKLASRDPDGLVALLQDLIPEKSVIIFCPTKLGCENVCKLISHIAPKSLLEYKLDVRRSFVAFLKENEDGNLYPGLEIGLMSGVAFHHSGLTMDERKIVETAFQEGAVSILCSTSTLSAGVNLPARRVIIKSPFVGREPLKKTQYLQMIGRAGRPGYDEEGDAVTIVHPGNEESRFREMLLNRLEDCLSALGNNSSMCSFLLDLLSLKIAETPEDFSFVMKATLLGMQNENAVTVAQKCLVRLCDEQVVSVSMDDVYKVTNLGSAAFIANISPLEARLVKLELDENLFKGIVFSSHFHLIFIVVPFDIFVTIDWNVLYEEYRIIPKEEQQLLASFGLSEKYLIKCLVSRPQMKEGDIAVRVFIAFMMHRLWNQEPLWSVSQRFGVSRGWLQTTLQSTCSQASSLARFSEKIPTLWPLKHLLPDLVRKLRECKEQELVPLLEVDGIKRARARQLYDQGFKTIGALANATSSVLVAAIQNLSRRQALVIIRSAQALIRNQIAEKVEEMETLGASSKDILNAFIGES